MRQNSEVFIGIDTSKLRNAVALADGNRGGEERYQAEIDATDAAARRMIAKLSANESCRLGGADPFGRL